MTPPPITELKLVARPGSGGNLDITTEGAVYKCIACGVRPEFAGSIAAAPEAYQALAGAYKALDLMREHLDDMRKSNPGYMGRMNLQDYALMNEAFIALDQSFEETHQALVLGGYTWESANAG